MTTNEAGTGLKGTMASALQSLGGLIALAGIVILLGLGWVNLKRALREKSGQYMPRRGDWVFGSIMAIITGVAIGVSFYLLIRWIKGYGILAGIIIWVFGFWLLFSTAKRIRENAIRPPKAVRRVPRILKPELAQGGAMAPPLGVTRGMQKPAIPKNPSSFEMRELGRTNAAVGGKQVRILDYAQELVGGRTLVIKGTATLLKAPCDWLFECRDVEKPDSTCYWSVTTRDGRPASKDAHLTLWSEFAKTALQDCIAHPEARGNEILPFVIIWADEAATDPAHYKPRTVYDKIEKQGGKPMTEDPPKSEIEVPVTLSVTVAADEEIKASEQGAEKGAGAVLDGDRPELPKKAKFTTDTVKDSYLTIVPWVKEIFGTNAQLMEDGYIRVDYGSTTIWIKVFPFSLEDQKQATKNDVIIMIWAFLTFGTEPKREMLLYLLNENNHVPFGGFGVDSDGRVLLKYSLVGSSCTEYELKLAIISLAQTADKYDDEIRIKFGGARFRDVFPIGKGK